MKRIFLLLYVIIFSASILFAQTEWKLDKAHSGITFAIKHMVIAEVVGNFREFSIMLKSSKNDFTDASVESVIKVASINTENSMRDDHLKSDDFFNAEKYPEIKFKSTAFEKTGENKYKITGDLTIRDVTKKVVFDAVLNGIIKTDRGLISGWKASTVINRFDYNLKWSKTLETGGLMVGQDVTITLNLELIK